MEWPHRRFCIGYAFSRSCVGGCLLRVVFPDLGEQSGGDSVSHETAPVQAIDLIEQRLIALVNIRHLGVVDERLDCVLELLDRFPLEVINAVKDR